MISCDQNNMAQPTKPGNSELGWNDPPMFLHAGVSPQTTGAATPKRNLLNKRVAHPGMTSGNAAASTGNVTGGEGQQKSPPLSGNMPPPSLKVNTGLSQPLPPSGNVVIHPPTTTTAIGKGPVPIIVPTMSPTSTSPPAVNYFVPGPPVTNAVIERPNAAATGEEDVAVPEFEDDEQFHHYAVTGLKKVLNDCRESFGPRVSEDVEKKLQIFETMWREGKLSYQVKVSMAKLSSALHKRKCDIAHQIHLGLMMDYVSEVGQWMVGVKRLINEARQVEKPGTEEESPDGVAAVSEVKTNEQIPNETKQETNLTNTSDTQTLDSSEQTDSKENEKSTNDGENL